MVDVLEAIVAHRRWTFATHVTVDDWNIGIVGHLSISYSAPERAFKSSDERLL